MSVVTARPLGSTEPPVEVLVPMPAFRYGLKKAMLPTLPGARFKVAAGADTIVDVPIAQARAVNGFLLFDVADLRPGAAYDGWIETEHGRMALFSGAELWRHAIGDPGRTVLAPAQAGR